MGCSFQDLGFSGLGKWKGNGNCYRFGLYKDHAKENGNYFIHYCSFCYLPKTFLLTTITMITIVNIMITLTYELPVVVPLSLGTRTWGCRDHSVWDSMTVQASGCRA